MDYQKKLQDFANELDLRKKLSANAAEHSKARKQFHKGKEEAFDGLLMYLSIHFNVKPNEKGTGK